MGSELEFALKLPQGARAVTRVTEGTKAHSLETRGRGKGGVKSSFMLLFFFCSSTIVVGS